MLESGRLPEDAKLFIQTFVNARNHLAHSLFVSLSAVHTSAGLDGLLREVAEMQEVFDRATQLFDQVLSNLAGPLGIELAKIKAEALAAVLAWGTGRNARANPAMHRACAKIPAGG